MAYAEALCHGLPVVGTTAGAIPDTIPPGAGLLVTPVDPTALASSPAWRYCRYRAAAPSVQSGIGRCVDAADLAAIRSDLCRDAG